MRDVTRISAKSDKLRGGHTRSSVIQTDVPKGRHSKVLWVIQVAHLSTDYAPLARTPVSDLVHLRRWIALTLPYRNTKLTCSVYMVQPLHGDTPAEVLVCTYNRSTATHRGASASNLTSGKCRDWIPAATQTSLTLFRGSPQRLHGNAQILSESTSFTSHHLLTIPLFRAGLPTVP